MESFFKVQLQEERGASWLAEEFQKTASSSIDVSWLDGLKQKS